MSPITHGLDGGPSRELEEELLSISKLSWARAPEDPLPKRGRREGGDVWTSPHRLA